MGFGKAGVELEGGHLVWHLVWLPATSQVWVGVMERRRWAALKFFPVVPAPLLCQLVGVPECLWCGVVVGQGLGAAGVRVVQPWREFKIAGDSLHVLLLTPEYVLGPSVPFAARRESGRLARPVGRCEVATESLAGLVCLLAGPGGFQVSLRLQLEPCDMGPQRWDCHFSLQGLVVGGLECSSDHVEALLLDLFQRLSNPLLFGWSQGAFKGGPDCCSIGETWLDHCTVDQPCFGEAGFPCGATQSGEGVALLCGSVTSLADVWTPAQFWI